MSDIELVIKIPKELYEAYEGRPPMLGDAGMDMIAQSISNGTPLPKGHGDLVDRSEVIKSLFNYHKGKKTLGQCIEDVQTIIEVDKEYEEE